jgi:hypothetical protein
MNIDREILVDAVAKLILEGRIPLNALSAPETPVKNPRVQTHASAGTGRLSGSVKRTMTSRIMDIPLGTAKFFETPLGVSHRRFVSRVRGFNSGIYKTHGYRITVNKVEGGCMVSRRKAA